jgi:hypothetical protein
MNMKRIVCILSLSFVSTLSLQAQDSVIAKGGKVYAVNGDQQTEIVDSLKFPSEVVISNNCTFTVGKGKERRLGEGQMILRDGWLVSQGGSVQPVFDHVFMQAGRVLVIRDGQAETLSQSLDFPNNTVISPDGYYSYPGGRRARLLDGEWFRLDGTAIPTKDAVTFLSGQVVLQKDGSIIRLQPVQIMGMNDGTRVHGDGTIQRFNGPTTKLREGQTILIDGPNIKR